MATIHYLQSDFTSGILDPALFNRADIAQFNRGLRQLINFFVLAHGGIQTRPGTEHLGKLKDQTTDVKLLPFSQSQSETYQVETGDTYFRFYKDGARIVESTFPITSFQESGSIPGEWEATITSHPYSVGEWIQIDTQAGLLDVEGTWVISAISGDDVSLQGSFFDSSVVYTPIGDTAAKVYELAHTYTAAEVKSIRWAQDSEKLYLAHGDHPPAQLSLVTANSFALNAYPYDGGPFQPLNQTAMTMNASGTTGTITVTASAAYFTDDMVGMLMRIYDAAGSPLEQGFVQFTGKVSTIIMNAVVQSTLSASLTASTKWALGSWGAETGYPQEVTLVQGRVVFAKTRTEPDGIWASASSGTVDYTVNLNDDRAFSLRMFSREANAVQWLAGQQNLLIGTTRAEFSISSGENGITPVSARGNHESGYGSNDVRPVQVGADLVYVARNGRKVRGIEFDRDTKNFNSADLSLLARHIIKNNPVVQMAYQQEPESVVWMQLTDGTLASMTWLKEQSVLAWGKSSLGAGVVLDIVGTINDSAPSDDVHMIVERNGQRNIERFNPATFLDSYVIGNANTNTVYGLKHLEGLSVVLTNADAEYRPKVVTGGKIEIDIDEPLLDNSVPTYVGVLIEASAVPMEPEVDIGTGTSFGREKRLVEISVRTTETRSIILDGHESDSRDAADLMDTASPIPEYSDHKFNPLGNDTPGLITIEHKKPFPATVLGWYGKIELGD